MATCLLLLVLTIRTMNIYEPLSRTVSGYLLHRHGKSPFLIGKPSIFMGHGFHGKLLVITRGYDHRISLMFSGATNGDVPMSSSAMAFQVVQRYNSSELRMTIVYRPDSLDVELYGLH